METLFSLIDAQARQRAEATAVLATTRPALSYAALLTTVWEIAGRVAANGVQRGDRVAIVLPNGPDAALSFLGVASVATSAPLNPGYSRDEFAFYMGDVRAKLLIADAAAGPAAVEAARGLGIRVLPFPLPASGDGGSETSVAFAEPDDVALVLHTSGTTSRPKIVPLTHRNLVCSARNIARALALTPADRSLNIMPLFHVHGLVGAVLSSLAAGASVVCTPGFDAMKFFDWMNEFAPTWYTGVPTMHQAIVARARTSGGIGATAGNGRLRFIRSCSSALPPTLMAEVEKTFRVPMIEACGMTEASHQLACNPLPPRPRKPGSIGVATGPEIAVMDEAGALLPVGRTGEIVLRGASITRGYESPADANAKAFTNGWFRTGDQGHIDAEGYVFLTGRIKELINRGGEKISPREIDEALLEHPAVAQAIAFARPHATLGEDVVAAVVLRAGASATPTEIREFAFQRLAAFKVPSLVLVVDAIPKGPTGKPQRIGLAEKLADRLATVFVAPRDEIESVLADIWQEVLSREKIGVHDNFFALGGDSLRGARITARVNELFAITLAVTMVFHHPTIDEFTRAVRAVATPQRLAEITSALRELEEISDDDARRMLDGDAGVR